MNWDSDTPYYGREWFNRSVVLHRHDHGKRMYRPTPRVCPGVERPKDFPDKLVFWGVCVLFVISVVWRLA
jgi:hypothetical protein